MRKSTLVDTDRHTTDDPRVRGLDWYISTMTTEQRLDLLAARQVWVRCDGSTHDGVLVRVYAVYRTTVPNNPKIKYKVSGAGRKNYSSVCSWLHFDRTFAPVGTTPVTAKDW